MFRRQIVLSAAVASCLLATGCTSSKRSDTARTGVEQMLISNAVDQSLDRVDFGAFRGARVFVDEKYIDAVDKNGDTAMHAAAYRDRSEPIKHMAAKGASIEVWNRKNKQGSTPLAIAAGYRGSRSFRPQPKAEAAIREVMTAAGLHVPETVAAPATGPKQGY